MKMFVCFIAALLLLLPGKALCQETAAQAPETAGAQPPAAAEIEQAQAKADADAKKARAEAAMKEAEILALQGQLEAEVKRLEEEKARKDAELEGLRSRYEANEKETEELKKRSEDQRIEADEIAGSVKGIVQDLGNSISQSMVSGELPGRRKVLEPLMSPTEFPSIEHIRKMGELMFDEIKRNGAISKATVTYIDAAGKQISGEVIRIGAFNALWHRDGQVGYLEYAPGKESFTQFTVAMPAHITRAAKKFVKGAAQSLYIDPSSGGAFRQLSDMPTWWEELTSGGPLMWPICASGLLGLMLALERLVVLWREGKKTEELSRNVSPIIQGGNWDAALQQCTGSTVGLAQVLATGITHRQENIEVLESVLEESIQGTLRPLDRNMAALQIIAVVAPLLGLLGTVTGMIVTFQMMTIHGSGDPRMMSGGISEALITTEYGLLISIPIIVAHGYFQGRVERIVNILEEKSMMLVNVVKKMRSQQ